MKYSKRIYWLDILRIAAIFFVITQHTIYITPNNYINFFLMPIYVCGVPIFITLSGALLLNKKENYKEFYIKRFGRILLPWIFWSSIYLYWEIFLGRVTFNLSVIREFYVFFMSRFWFMPLIAVIYLVTPIIRIFVLNARRKDIEYLLALWFFLVPVAVTFFVLIGSSKPPPNSALVIFIGYFILGNLLMKLKVTWKIFLFSLMTLLFSSIISSYLVFTGVISNGLFAYSSFFIVLNTASIFLIFKKIFLSFNPNQQVKKIVVGISGMSLGIYLTHEIVLGILHSFIGKTENILYAIPVFLMSIFLVLVLRRILGETIVG